MDEEYLFKCGSCKFLKRGRCTNYESDCCDGLVDNDCSCSEYLPRSEIYTGGLKVKSSLFEKSIAFLVVLLEILAVAYLFFKYI